MNKQNNTHRYRDQNDGCLRGRGLGLSEIGEGEDEMNDLSLVGSCIASKLYKILRSLKEANAETGEEDEEV